MHSTRLKNSIVQNQNNSWLFQENTCWPRAAMCVRNEAERQRVFVGGRVGKAVPSRCRGRLINDNQ